MRPDPAGLALAGLSIAYPLLVVLALRWLDPLVLVVLLLALAALRGLLARRRPAPLPGAAGMLALALPLAALALVDADLALRLYPVLMNAVLLATFAASLWRGPSMIERFARLAEPDLPPSGVRYTRKVTIAWCVLFAGNGGIALWTALAAPLRTWALYNGVIAYLLMAALLGGELLVRGQVRRRAAALARD
jgi:uncharacterized membrane protein